MEDEPEARPEMKELPKNPKHAGPVKIDCDWQTRRESRVIMNCLFRRKERIQFGILEQLNPYSSLLKVPTTYHCKLLLYGKAGVGKTSTVLKLCGKNVPKTHIETLGIQTSVTYWPARLLVPGEEVVVLKLEFWDACEKSVYKFDHVLPSMIASTNTIAFLFSFTDRSSWNELPFVIERMKQKGKLDSHLKIIIGTHADCVSPKVTPEDISLFEKKHNISILKISNLNGPLLSNGLPDGQSELNDTLSFMNTITQLVMDYQLQSTASVINGNSSHITRDMSVK